MRPALLSSLPPPPPLLLFSDPARPKAKVRRRKLKERPLFLRVAQSSPERGSQRSVCRLSTTQPTISSFHFPDFLNFSTWTDRSRNATERSVEEHPSVGNMGAAESVQDVRIVMIGKTGNGKSATGNTILGREAFFSKMVARSVTAQCKKETCTLPDNRTLAVIDTPGFFDTECSEGATLAEVRKCTSFCSPGPHAIIQVIRLGHFSKEELEIAQLIKKVFSLKAKAYMIILFTRKEDLEGRPLSEVLKEESVAALREQIESCGNRCLAFNNRAKGKEREDQVRELIQMVDNLIQKNKTNPYYTKDMLEEDKKRAPRCILL